MTATTIKVDTALRDRLKAQAAEEGRTLGEHLTALAEREDRRRRMAALREAIAATPASSMQEYRAEVAELDAAVARDGLSGR